MKTVSRVMNNEPSVSDKTRQIVKEAARVLNYTPNLAARGLASSKSYLLAIFYDVLSPGSVLNIQMSAAKVCRKFGYHLVVEPLNSNETDMVEEVERVLGSLRVDGVILAPPLRENEAIIAALTRRNIIYIPMGPTDNLALKSVSAQSMDDPEVVREMTEYLIDSIVQ